MTTQVTDQALRTANLQLSRLAGLVHAPVLTEKSLAWSEAGPLMLANTARLALSITQLQPNLYYESAILCRCLFEHVVTFCWIATDPDSHFARWCQTDFGYRAKTINDAQSRNIKIGSMRAPVKGGASIPGLDVMCLEADRFWISRLKEFGGGKKHELRSIYTVLYRYFSAAAHGQGLALQTLVRRDQGGRLSVDLSAPDLARAVVVAPAILGLALFVAAEIFGVPDRSDVHAIFEQTRV
jgi:hypothetical protein